MAQFLVPQGIVAPDVGDGLLGKAQGLWCINRRWWCHLAVGQPVQDIENVGLGRHPSLKGQLDSAKHRLLIVMQHQRQDLGHLPVATEAPQKLALQLPERIGHIGERRPVTQGARFALDYRQIILS